MVDTNDNTKALYQSLVFGGYDPRAIIPKEGLSKRLLNNQTKVLSDSLRDEPKAESGSLLKIVQLNAEGNAVETWTLVNSFIKSTNFGQLDYSSDELVKLELVIVYDYALLE
jgi:hypothetical protein